MKKTDIKRIFKAIERNDQSTLFTILSENPEDIDVFGFHNKNCRDKTPLMYALQCENFDIANKLISMGANINASMAGGPCSSVIQLSARFGHGLNPNFNEWLKFIEELIDLGAYPDDAIWTACHAYNKHSDKPEIIALLLSKGANPDIQVGDTESTVRELVAINSKLFSPYVLSLFEIDT